MIAISPFQLDFIIRSRPNHFYNWFFLEENFRFKNYNRQCGGISEMICIFLVKMARLRLVGWWVRLCECLLFKIVLLLNLKSQFPYGLSFIDTFFTLMEFPIKWVICFYKAPLIYYLRSSITFNARTSEFLFLEQNKNNIKWLRADASIIFCEFHNIISVL